MMAEAINGVTKDPATATIRAALLVSESFIQIHLGSQALITLAPATGHRGGSFPKIPVCNRKVQGEP